MDGIATPTHTALSDDEYMGLDPRFSKASTSATPETVPWPGNKFVIRERASGRAIALVDGELRLSWWDCAGDRGAHWICEDKNGWLGFRNPVSNTYMGKDNRGNFYAKANQHRAWEYFCAMRHPEGGYILLMRHWDELLKMAVGEDGCKLVTTKGEGTVWEFLKL
ncbi:hypothetical protein DL767_001637 [Monosporascus sp. MG133]|nr:hypothetical protein DL767_001637 [Monosporascus sp. MG133]